MSFRLQWASPNDQWSAALIGTNLADEFHYESQFDRPFAPYFAGTGRPGWPREWYVTLRRTF